MGLRDDCEEQEIPGAYSMHYCEPLCKQLHAQHHTSQLRTMVDQHVR